MNAYKWEGNEDVKIYAQEGTKIFIRIQKKQMLSPSTEPNLKFKVQRGRRQDQLSRKLFPHILSFLVCFWLWCLFVFLLRYMTEKKSQT